MGPTHNNRVITSLATEKIVQEFSSLLFCVCEDCYETFALCCLCGVCVWRCERAADYLAAIAGTYASADMAGCGAGCAACRGAGGRQDDGEGVPRCRQAGSGGEQRVAAYDDGLFANWKEYGRCRRRISGRGVPGPGYRPGRHRGLRLADFQGDHLCAVEVPGAGERRLFQIGAVSKIRTLSRITDGVRRCAEDAGAAPHARGGLAHRSTQDWSAWVFVRRASIGSDQHAL